MFSTLIISIPMETHQHSSGSYPNSFTTEEAIANLGSLKLTRTHSMPDQKDPSKIVSTTTITKFSMSKSTAKAACQTFMDARLFENLLDPTNRSFKDKSIYGLTPKGIYILERFVSINNLKAPHLLKIFSSKSTKIRLFAVERNHETDSITLSKQNIESIFRRFAGSKPNVVNEISSSIDRNLGIELKVQQFNNKNHRTFSGKAACDWLRDFTTLISKKEAKKIVTEFIRRGLIKAVDNDIDDNIEKKDSKNDNSKLKYSKFNHYIILEKGKQIALWKYDVFRTSTLSTLSTSLEGENVNNLKKDDNSKMKNQETFNKSGENELKESQVYNNNKEYPSNFKKLQQILDDKNLCSLFMNFSKSILCEENLLFLLEVQNFKTKYTSTNINENGNPIEQEDLIVDAFKIYNDYLASNSRHELNIDFNLSQPMTQYMTSIADNVNRKDPITSHLFDKIQDVIYRLTAIDSVPKFIRTKEYLTYVRDNARSDSITSEL
jgi:hypothetical protein